MNLQDLEQVRWSRFQRTHFVDDLGILLSQDMDETILLPIIRVFFLYSLGKLDDVSLHNLIKLEKAFEMQEEHDAKA